MRNLILLTAVFAIAAIGVLGMVSSANAADDEPKYTTKQVMKQAHKDKLLQKVLGGDASDAEKEKLLELYTALAKNKPKKGDEESWKKKTEAIVAAAKAGDNSALRTATNCRGCHSMHR